MDPKLDARAAEDLLSDLPPLVTVKRAAETLDVSDRTIRRYIASGRLRAIKTHDGPGGLIRIPRSALVDLLVRMAS